MALVVLSNRSCNRAGANHWHRASMAVAVRAFEGVERQRARLLLEPATSGGSALVTDRLPQLHEHFFVGDVVAPTVGLRYVM